MKLINNFKVRDRNNNIFDVKGSLVYNTNDFMIFVYQGANGLYNIAELNTGLKLNTKSMTYDDAINTAYMMDDVTGLNVYDTINVNIKIYQKFKCVIGDNLKSSVFNSSLYYEIIDIQDKYVHVIVNEVKK